MDTQWEPRTELERLAAPPVAAADALAGRFPVAEGVRLAGDADYTQAMETLAFGRRMTDHMAHMRWTPEQGWHDREIVEYGALGLEPAAAVLHYGQSVFEGIKAYRHADGSVWTFRPTFNAARINHSARRLAMPEMEREDFVASLVDYVRADERWVPSADGASLYMRPFMFASEAFLGVHAAGVIDYYVIGSPVGPYFSVDGPGVAIWVVKGYHRAGPGGTGSAKAGGNYAASLLPQMEAASRGFDQVCFLDTYEERYLEELGGMNVFVVMADGSMRTPELSGVILEGGTRGAIIRLLHDRGVQVREERIALDALVEEIQRGDVAEIFACGTAAVVTPIGRLAGEDFDCTLPVGEVTRSIREELTGIQTGKRPDPYGWMYRLV